MVMSFSSTYKIICEKNKIEIIKSLPYNPKAQGKVKLSIVFCILKYITIWSNTKNKQTGLKVFLTIYEMYQYGKKGRTNLEITIW